MISIDLRVSGDEVLLRLDQLPRRVRQELTKKFEAIFARMEGEMLQGVPGKFIDPARVRSGTSAIGSLLIGYIEVEDKPGVYAIYPTKARVLRFLAKDGDWVHTPRVLLHPFLKGAPVVERYLREQKPWLYDMIEDAVIEAL